MDPLICLEVKERKKKIQLLGTPFGLNLDLVNIDKFLLNNLKRNSPIGLPQKFH
jgi:hypothetical protein